jgi:photosystem II stability/assembly factor-like uncharacterized protein
MKFVAVALLAFTAAQEDSGNGPRRAPPRWTEVDHVPQGWMTDVFFLDENRGWILSAEGALSATTDGGRTWVSVRAAARGEYCRSVCFLDSRRGFIVGGLRGCCDTVAPAKLCATEDGGRTWTDLTHGLPDTDKGDFDKIQFLSPTEGFIFGRQLLATRDAGKTWSALGPDWLHVSGWNSCFATPKTGWVVYDDNLWRSEDGGNSWQPTGAVNALTDEERVHSGLRYPSFQTEQFGWVLSERGTILRSEDGGLSWKRLEGFRGERLHQLVVVDPSNAWVLSARGDDVSRILRTTDGGRTWKESVRTQRRLQRIFFLRPDFGWAVGDGAILRLSAN